MLSYFLADMYYNTDSFNGEDLVRYSVFDGEGLPLAHTSPILKVWNANLPEGVLTLCHLATDCHYVAVDTEFPGVVAQLTSDCLSPLDRAYGNIKVNVDLLRPLEIAFSFFRETGHRLCTGFSPVCTIQFNLKWDVHTEPYDENSIHFLQECGLDLDRLQRDGIDTADFLAAISASGLLRNPNITWIGFQCAYDFAFLMKIIAQWPQMPSHAWQYEILLQVYFPRIVDVKALLVECGFVRGGLQALADALGVPREGRQHEAGSDALLTGEAYFHFLQRYQAHHLPSRLLNLLCGLNYFPFAIP